MRALFGILCLAVAASHAQTPATTPPAAAPPATPAATGQANAAPASKGSTYRNEAMHLTLTYPSSFMDGSEMLKPFLEKEKQSADPDIQKVLKCTTVPLGLMDMTNGSMVMLMQMDGDCQHIGFDAASLNTVAQSMLGEAASTPGFKSMGSTPYEISGHPAVLVGGGIAIPNGPTMQFSMTCIAAKPNLACFELIATTPDGMAKLSSFQIAFDGSAPVPLVPADVLKK